MTDTLGPGVRIPSIRKTDMRFRFLFSLFILALCLPSPAWDQGVSRQSAPKSDSDISNSKLSLIKVPAGVILVKGAWSSASDSVTALPEGGNVVNSVLRDQYFGMAFTLPPNWTEKYRGPPPSDTGLYVLAQLSPADAFKGFARASILITAQDMFFTPLPASNAAELIGYTKNHLQAGYKVETPPTRTKIANRPFIFFAYWSPLAELHWYVLATEIRRHALQIVLTSRDAKLLESLILDINKMSLPTEANPIGGDGGGSVPVCIKDYARDENMITRANPVFTDHKFNPVPVRIIIDKNGIVKHIHVLSAFPDQAKLITDALGKWKFKPYQRNGQRLEVETGIVFGQPPTGAPEAAGAAIQ